MERASWDEYFMGMTQYIATRGTCDRKHVGAVLVRDHRILSTGYNGSIPGQPHCSDPEMFWECTNCHAKYTSEPPNEGGFGYICMQELSCAGKKVLGPLHGGHDMIDGHCIRTIHAEVNTISQAALVGTPTQGATLYCNTFPCYPCFKVIVAAGIQEMIYLDDYKASGAERVLEAAEALAKRGFRLRQFISRR